MVKTRSFTKHFGHYRKANAFYDKAQVHLQVAYCDPTLGYKIKIETVGKYSFKTPKYDNLRADDHGADRLEQDKVNERYLVRGAQLVVYLADGIGRGIATVGIVCQPKSNKYKISNGDVVSADMSKFSINEYTESAAGLGKVRKFCGF